MANSTAGGACRRDERKLIKGRQVWITPSIYNEERVDFIEAHTRAQREYRGCFRICIYSFSGSRAAADESIPGRQSFGWLQLVLLFNELGIIETTRIDRNRSPGRAAELSFATGARGPA